MQLKEIMTPQVECIPPDTTLAEAAEIMRDRDIGPLPVCDHDRLAGIITDRDITIRGVAGGCDVATTRVGDVMTRGVEFCFEDDEVETAERIMKENQIRRLLVLNRDKRLVGIVSLGDLALKTHDDRQVGETLERISEPGATR
jgi:CBS domain-containing protein